MTIDRESLKSDYLEWENGKTIRIRIERDAIEASKPKADGGKYPVFNLKVKPVTGGEAKKIQLFKREYVGIVKQSDEKAGMKLPTLVGCIFDYTITIVEDEVKGSIWDKKIILVSCPTEKVEA